MQLQTKLLSTLLFLLSITTLLIYVNYTIHKTHYNDMIEYSINGAVDKVKYDIQKADTIVADIASFKSNVFRNIHQLAHQKLKENPNLDIEQLKMELLKSLPHKLVHIEIYLINRDYRIYATTYQADLNLDMRNFLGAQEFVDESFAHIDKIYFAPKPTFDIMTNQYRIYSYSAINDRVALEVGFFDDSLSQIKDKLYQFNVQDGMIQDIDIYADYGKYIINIAKIKNRRGQSKESYMKDLLKNRDKFVTQMVKSQGKYHYDIQEGSKSYRLCYRYIARSKISPTQFTHYVLRAKVDTTKFKRQLKQLKYTLYITSTVIFFIILFFILFFIRTILNPFKTILEKLKSTGSIEDDKMLAKNDEFGQLSCNINKISSELSSTQQEVNKKADELENANTKLSELNAHLQERIDDEVAKNRMKDQQLLAQSRLAQMGEMIAMIAHQWRQPLAAINSIALNLQIRSSFGEQQVNAQELFKSTQDISKYALHLSETIDEFRDFFKPQKLLIETTFDEILEGVYKIIQESLEVHNITLIEELNFHERFVAYPKELKHVVLNLLKNAQDAFIENKIEKREIIIRTYAKGDEKILEVKDNAGGIPKEIITKIFDPYFSTKSNRNGTGLGLYMSKMIVEKHSKGKFNVESRGDTTIFRVIL